jgi:hypothetical protein
MFDEVALNLDCFRHCRLKADDPRPASGFTWSSSMSRLKQALIAEYSWFSDKRIKKLENGKRFVVDGRSNGNFAGARRFFAKFCMILADVESEEEVTVTLAGTIPIGDKVEEWLALNHSIIRDSPRPELRFTVSPTSCSMLDSLADAIMAIVAPHSPR